MYTHILHKILVWIWLQTVLAVCTGSVGPYQPKQPVTFWFVIISSLLRWSLEQGCSGSCAQPCVTHGQFRCSYITGPALSCAFAAATAPAHCSPWLGQEESGCCWTWGGCLCAHRGVSLCVVEFSSSLRGGSAVNCSCPLWCCEANVADDSCS